MEALSIDIAPLIQESIDRAVARRLAKEPDYRRWWTASDVSERYSVTQTWLRRHVLDVPRFQQQLRNCAQYYGGRIGWRFEPKGFSDFMRESFASIAQGV
ncbi:DUF771 domain-containing protein [Lacticaseibacillus pantheris]|uniref:DUF771 domain-containing protein n=1 Tax=Lacticaseibacillus pantheris TaxID=171523 RepID=UPI00265994E4|nr:DUF771 domain-containing protein [Lacticaseibacillus pantheris]WKF84458.1 DUF771 domain-containing protein [Lacticaseibacillus pantheris]